MGLEYLKWIGIKKVIFLIVFIDMLEYDLVFLDLLDGGFWIGMIIG